MLRGLPGKTGASLSTYFSTRSCSVAKQVDRLPPENTYMTSTYRRKLSSGQACEPSQDVNGFTRRLADSWDSEELKILPERLRPVKGETLDLILRKKVYLLQSRRGYRANVDSHMLALFASDAYGRVRQGIDPDKLRVLDLGAGNGLVSILFAKAHEFCDVHLVELQPQLADRARRNLELNDISGSVTQHDLKNGDLPKTLRESFDVVLINPPFYPDGAIGRKPPKHKEKYLAHLETSASLSDFLSAAYSACDPQNRDAFVAIVHDRKELPRLQKSVYQNNFVIQDSREMIHVVGEEPSRILLKVKPRGMMYCSQSEKTPWNDVVHSSNELMQKEHTPSDDIMPSLSPLILHPSVDSQSVYTAEIEQFLEKLPLPSLRIGRLREIAEA